MPFGLPPLSVSYLVFSTSPALSLPMPFSPSPLWHWIWVISFRSSVEEYSTAILRSCSNTVLSTWAMVGWVSHSMWPVSVGPSSFVSFSHCQRSCPLPDRTWTMHLCVFLVIAELMLFFDIHFQVITISVIVLALYVSSHLPCRGLAECPCVIAPGTSWALTNIISDLNPISRTSLWKR